MTADEQIAANADLWVDRWITWSHVRRVAVPQPKSDQTRASGESEVVR